MWGTDMTTAFTSEHGQVAVFVAVDHCSAECVGLHAALRGTRHEALEPVRQGVAERFGPMAQDVAQGLSIRHDPGSQYMAHDVQKEIAWLGAFGTPSDPWRAAPHRCRPLSARPKATAAPSASSGP
jgi:transposase InsO family protein